MKTFDGEAQPPVRLDEFDKDEWYYVARMFYPQLTDEQYDVMWAEFQLEKTRKELQ